MRRKESEFFGVARGLHGDRCRETAIDRQSRQRSRAGKSDFLPGLGHQMHPFPVMRTIAAINERQPEGDSHRRLA